MSGVGGGRPEMIRPSSRSDSIAGRWPCLDCTSGRITQVASANGWPEREIAEVHFMTADGHCRLVFKDGSETTGSSSQP